MCNNCNCKSARESEVPMTFDCSILDAAAYIHRQGLDKIGSHPKFPELDFKERFDVAKRVTAKRLANLGEVDIAFMPLDRELEIVQAIVSKEPKQTILWAVDQDMISHKGAEVVGQILKITKSKLSFELKMQRYEELKGFVQSLKNIPQHEVRALYLALVIAKGSELYWKEVESNPQSPYFKIIMNLPPEAQYRPRWWDIGAALLNCLGCAAGVLTCVACGTASSVLVSSLAGETK